MQLLLGLTEGLLRRLEAPGRPAVGRLGLGHGRLQLVTGLLGLGQPFAQLVVLALQETRPPLGGGQARPQLVERPPVTVEGVLEGRQLALGHHDRFAGLPQERTVPPGLEMGLELRGGGRLQAQDPLLVRGEGRGLGRRRLQLLAQPRPFGLEGGDHVGVGRRVERLGQRPLTLAEHTREAAGPLDQALGPTQGRGQVRLALCGHLVRGALAVLRPAG